MVKFLAVLILASVLLWYAWRSDIAQSVIESFHGQAIQVQHDSGKVASGMNKETIDRSRLMQKKEQVDQVFREMDREIRRMRR